MNTKQLKDKILAMAMRGELVEQDPTDESAQVLLEKIKKEKAKLIAEKKIKKEKPLAEVEEDEIPYELPQGWVWTRLGEIALINPRNTLDDELETSFVSMSAIQDNFKNTHLSETRSWGEIKKGFTHFKEGDIGIAKITPCFENGKTVIFKDLVNGYGAGTTELFVIRPYINEVETNYLYANFATSKFIKDGVNTYSGTSGHQRVSKDFIINLLIPLPPLAEQKRIVEKIETLFAEVDKLEESRENLDGLKGKLDKKLLDMAMRGELVEQDPSDESAEVLLEKIKEEKAKLIAEKKIKKEKPLAPIEEDEIPYDLPQGWVWTRLGEIADYKKGPFGSALTKKMFIPDSEDSIKVYEQKNAIRKDENLGDYFIPKEYYEESMQSFTVLGGDLIVSCAGTIGEQYFLPEDARVGIINQALMRVRVSKNIERKYYSIIFDMAINSKGAEAQGTAIKNIPPFSVLKNLLVPIPPSAEQKRIVERLETVRKVINESL